MKKILIIPIFLFAVSLFAQSTLQEEQDYEFSVQLMNKEMYDLAAVQFMKFKDHYPGSLRAPQALMNAGTCYENLDSLAQAASCYFTILMQYPNSDLTDQSMLKRGKLLIKNKEFANGAASLERMLVFVPKSPLVPEAQLEAAKAYYEIAEYPKALDAVSVIVERYPEDTIRPQAHLLIAKIRGQMGQMDLAFTELEKITGNNIESEITQQALLAKAELYEKSGRFSLSDNVLAELVKSNTLSEYVMQAGLRYALSRQAFGDYEGSNQIVISLLKKQPSGFYASRYHMVVGDNAFAIQDFQSALSAYSQCDTVALDPGWYAGWLFRMGNTLGKLARYREAEQYLNIMLQNSENTDPVLLGRALLIRAEQLGQSDRPLDAITMLQRAQNIPVYLPIQDEIQLTMGKIRETGLHDWAGARQNYAALQSVVMNSPYADDAQLAIARTFENEQDLEQALKAYQRFLNIYPASEYDADVMHKVFILQHEIPVANSANQPGSMALLPTMFQQKTPQTLVSLAAYYMNNAHDYPSAILAMDQALAMDSGESLNRQEILYNKAKCHSILAQLNAYRHQPVLFKTQCDSVDRIYDFMRRNYPDSPWTWRTLTDKVRCDLDRLDSASSMAFYLDSTLVKYPEAYQDSSWLELDLLRGQQIVKTMTDSTDWLALQKANLICNQILAQKTGNELHNQALLLNAEILYKLAETDSAMGILGQLQNGNDPVSVRARFLQAKLLRNEGKYQEALRLYSHLMENHSYSEIGKQSAIASVDILIQLGKTGQAREILDRYKTGDHSQFLPAFFFDSVDSDWIWMAAKLAQAREDDLAAMETLRQYIYTSTTRIHQPEALLLLGNIARDHHNNEIAVSHYAELFTEFPDDTLAQVARINTAQIFFDMGDYATALQQYKVIKNLLTGELRTLAFAREIICEIDLGNLPRAKQLEKEFSKNFKAPNYEADFLYEEGLYHIRQKDFDLAEDVLKNLSKKYDDIPEGGKGQLGLARMYVITGKPDQALDILTRIPDKYSDPVILATAYLNLGDFYYENRQLPQCINACEKVTELVQTGQLHRDALNLLIKTYDQYKFWDKAIALIREYIAKYPNDPDLMTKRIQIGTMLHDLKDYDRSVSYLKQLKPLVSATEEPEVQYWIARSYLDKGDTQQAIVEFLKVRYLSKPTKLPWGVTALYEAGNAYYKLGNTEKAIDLLEQVVRERGLNDNIGRAASERIKTIREETAGVNNG